MKKILFLLLLFYITTVQTQAQSLLGSMGVENGNLNSWSCFTGTCCPVNTTQLGIVNGRHTVVSGNSLDSFGHFSKVCPWGGNYSLRIGNDSVGAQAESASFNLVVDSSNYYITIAYAAVLQMSAHAPSTASRFYFRVKDNFGNDIFNSSQCAYCNQNPYPAGLHKSVVDTNVNYLPWTQQIVDLKNYIHQQVTFEILAGDDASGNQFGYGYFDLVSAGTITVTESWCIGNSYLSLFAPTNFQSYQWFDAANNAVGNTSSIQLSNPNLSSFFNNIYHVVLTPTSGSGMVDTVFYKIKLNPRNPPLGGFSTSLLCANTLINFIDSSSIDSANVNDPVAFIQWNFGDAASGANNYSGYTSPSHQFSNGGAFTIIQNITSIYGCNSSYQKRIFINAAPIANAGFDDSVCVNQPYLLGGNGSVGINYLYQWSSNGALSNSSIPHPIGLFNANNSFAIVTVLDLQTQCTASDTIKISLQNNCFNHSPIANNDNAFIAFGQTKNIAVLQNDVDTDGNLPPQGNLTTATVTLVHGASHGIVTVVGNQIQYSPSNNLFIGVDTIMYVLCDNGSPNYCDSATLFVHVYQTLKVNLGNDLTVCYNHFAASTNNPINGGSGSFQYVWSHSNLLSCTNCTNPVFQNLATTLFQLKVIDVLTQQQDSDQILIKIDTPKIALGNDVFVTHNFPNDTLHVQNLGSSGISNYSWNPAPSNFYNNSSQPIYVPTITTNVVLQTVDANGCNATDTIIIFACSNDCVYPGDADDNGVVNNFDIFKIGLGYDSTGSARLISSNHWDGYPAQNWADTIAGINAKYADCNGDGIINANDTLALNLNYTGTHAPLLQNNQLPIYVTLPHATLRDSARIYCGISLGDNLKQGENVYGVAFTFHFDTLVVDTSTIQFQWNTPNWLAVGNNDYLQIKKYYRSKGLIDVGLVRNTHLGNSGFGNLATVTIDIVTGNVIGRMKSIVKDFMLHCSISDIRIIDANGKIIESVATADSATIEYNATGIGQMEWLKNVTLMPNPAQHEFMVKAASDVVLQAINLKNILGVSVRELKLEHNNHQQQISILTQNLPNGTYIVNIETNKGIVVKHLMIQH